MSGGSGGSPRDGGGGGPGKEPLDPWPLEGPSPQEEDEPPGSYLAELGAGAANIAWGAINLALVLALGTAAAGLGITPGSPWHSFSRLVWSLLPISAIILLIVTIWQAGNAYASPARGKTTASLALAAGSLALWLVLRFALGVLPAA